MLPETEKENRILGKHFRLNTVVNDEHVFDQSLIKSHVATLFT